MPEAPPNCAIHESYTSGCVMCATKWVPFGPGDPIAPYTYRRGPVTESQPVKCEACGHDARQHPRDSMRRSCLWGECGCPALLTAYDFWSSSGVQFVTLPEVQRERWTSEEWTRLALLLGPLACAIAIATRLVVLL